MGFAPKSYVSVYAGKAYDEYYFGNSVKIPITHLDLQSQYAIITSMKYNIEAGQLVQVVLNNEKRLYGILKGYGLNVFGEEVIRLGTIGDTCSYKNAQVFFGYQISEIKVISEQGLGM